MVLAENIHRKDTGRGNTLMPSIGKYKNSHLHTLQCLSKTKNPEVVQIKDLENI